MSFLNQLDPVPGDAVELAARYRDDERHVLLQRDDLGFMARKVALCCRDAVVIDVRKVGIMGPGWHEHVQFDDEPSLASDGPANEYPMAMCLGVGVDGEPILGWVYLTETWIRSVRKWR